MHLCEYKSLTICQKFMENQPRFSENFMKNSVEGLSLNFHGNCLYFIFHQFSELCDNSPKILREFYCGYAIVRSFQKNIRKNIRSFHTKNIRKNIRSFYTKIIRMLVFRTDLISFCPCFERAVQIFYKSTLWTSDISRAESPGTSKNTFA